MDEVFDVIPRSFYFAQKRAKATFVQVLRSDVGELIFRCNVVYA